MTKFQYRLENGRSDADRYSLDLPDGTLAAASFKFAARYLAARHVVSGSLDLKQYVLLEDDQGRLLDRRPMGDFVRIS